MGYLTQMYFSVQISKYFSVEAAKVRLRAPFSASELNFLL